MPQPHFTPGKDPVPILQEAGWAPGWSGRVENLVPTGIRSRTVQPVVSNLMCIFLNLEVAQLVEALRYKPEGRGFDSRWCHWNFSLT